MSEPFTFRHLNRLVGLFVIAAVSVVLIGVVLVGRARHWLTKEFTVTVAFDRNNLGLLRAGLPVKIQGTDAGEVVDAAQETNRTIAHLSLREDFRGQLRRDAKAIIHTPIAGFLGETFIEIWPGQAEEGFNTQVGVITQLPGDDLLAQARNSISNFGEASAQLRDVISENRSEITATVAAVRATAETVSKLVADNRVAINTALTRMEEMSRQMSEMVAENRPAVKAAADALPRTLETVEHTVGAVGDAAVAATAAADAAAATARDIGEAARTATGLVADNRDQLALAMDDLHALLQRANAVAAELEVVSTQVASGQGTLGKLVMEDTVHDKAVQVADNANKTLEGLQPLISTITAIKLYLGVQAGSNLGYGVTSGSGYLRLEPSPDKFYQGGVTYRGPPRRLKSDVETNDGFPLDFDLQLGWRFFPHSEGSRAHWLWLSVGVLESRLGGVVGSQVLGDRLGLEVLLRGKHSNREVTDRRYEEGSVMVRAAASLRVVWDVSVLGGVDDIASNRHRGWWAGARVELLDNDLRNLTTFGPLFR